MPPIPRMRPSPIAAALALCALGATALAQTDQLVAPGATWSYLDDGSDQGSAWTGLSFDDSGWASGPAQLGYGDGDEATVVDFGPDPNDKYVTTWFRREFAVADASAYVALTVRLLRDDGAVVHLNGHEIARSNLPAGPIDYRTPAISTVSGAAEDAFFALHVTATWLVSGTNVLAVEIHQQSGQSSDISLDLELAGHRSPVLTRGPYLQVGTDASVRVRWRTAPATESRVWYGLGPDSLSMTVSDPGPTSEHELKLAGLAPDTKYYYGVGTTSSVLSGADLDHFFVTHPAPGERRPFRAWVLGDSGTASAQARSVRDAYYAFTGETHTDLWLMLGDNAYADGTDEEFQAAVFDMYPEMLRKSVLWPTRGNHDTLGSVYYGAFSMPTGGEAGGMPSGSEAYYSFDYANAHFVCLDSEGSRRAVDDAMYVWMESDLAATDQEWIIAYWHHPPYSKGSHDSDTEARLVEMRETFVPLLEAYGVDLVLTGHSHSYERSFLIDGHYGLSSTFSESMKKNAGDGKTSGDGAYSKADGAHEGAVYAVAGSSGQVDAGALDHPAMYFSVAVLGSVVIDVDGGRMDVRFLRASGAVPDHFTMLSESYLGAYCEPAPHSEGCVARIGYSGTPSASGTSPFVVSATAVRAGQFGLLFYGLRPAWLPFFGSRLCVGGALVRTALQGSGGDPGLSCDGSYAFDFNAWIRSGVDARLVPGEGVYAQYWFRDPGSAFGSAVSDALQFPIAP